MEGKRIFHSRCMTFYYDSVSFIKLYLKRKPFLPPLTIYHRLALLFSFAFSKLFKVLDE